MIVKWLWRAAWLLLPVAWMSQHFVHDDAAMARGEACTFVYKGNTAVKGNLVVSFHCIPAQRLKVASFTVRTQQSAPGIDELREFQFAGDTEAHMVPEAK